jgi:hypothetical protein
VREREREREREPPNRLEQYLQIHQTKKKSSCKESFNSTFKFSILYPIIIYLFILLLHTHYKICCKRIKKHIYSKTAANIDGQRKLKRAREKAKKTHTHEERKEERTGIVRFLRF